MSEYLITTEEDAKSSRYFVEHWTFPQDLFGNPESYGNSWVMININVQQASAAAAANKELGFVELSKAERRRFTNIDARGDSTAGAAAKLTGVSAGAGAVQGAVSGLKGALGKGASKKEVLAKTAVGAGVGAARGAAVGAALSVPIIAAGTASRETKRIKIAIQLPMPNALTTGYTMEWGEESTSMYDLMMRVPGMTADTVKKLVTGDTSAFTGPGDAAASLALGVQSAFGGGGISAATGLAANPKKEMIFSGVNFRNFTLDYKFYPKSQKEALNAKLIIDQLKYHMHPEYKSEGRFTFIYPSEFDITFFHKGVENEWVNKIATSVLTNLTVNYTPEGQWVSHNDGFPNTISLSMSFKELSILTKDEINQGF